MKRTEENKKSLRLGSECCNVCSLVVRGILIKLLFMSLYFLLNLVYPNYSVRKYLLQLLDVFI